MNLVKKLLYIVWYHIAHADRAISQKLVFNKKNQAEHYKEYSDWINGTHPFMHVYTEKKWRERLQYELVFYRLGALKLTDREAIDLVFLHHLDNFERTKCLKKLGLIR